jgi:hypothetical protein
MGDITRRFAAARIEPVTVSSAKQVGDAKPMTQPDAKADDNPVSDIVKPEKKKRNRRRDPFSRESLKPWEDLGISRSAWYLERRLERLLNKKLEERISSKPLPKAAPKPAPEPEPDSDDEWWSTKTKT